MKKFIISTILSLLLCTSSFAAPFIYFNWDGEKRDTTKIVLLGLPGSPIESDFVQATNPDDSNDAHYYKATYDLASLPNGTYSLSAKIKEGDTVVYTDANGVTHIVNGESSESDPFPFDKIVPVVILNMELDVQ